MLRDTSEDTSELRQVAPRNLLDGRLTQQYGEPVCRRIRIFEYVDGDRRFDTGEAGGAETQPANLARREIANLNASVVRYFDALSSNHFKRTINLHVLRHAHPQVHGAPPGLHISDHGDQLCSSRSANSVL